MPHTDAKEACSLVARFLPEIPAWPQLPKRSFLENMNVQFSEWLPGVVIEGERIYIDRAKNLDKPLERLYASYLENEVEKYAVSPDYAAGLHAFLETELGMPFAVKGHVTGPISWGLTVTDENRRPVLYDDVLADALAKHLRLKTAWQERELKAISPNTIIFVDEPYMASFGSAFVSLSQEQVTSLLEEVFSGISGLKGVHCCGNTDWPILLSTSLDILNFDAYNYGYTIALYPEEVKAFLQRGGVIAWGIVPSDEQALKGETVKSLLDRLEEGIGALDRKGVSFRLQIERCLLTPSCGLGSISEEGAAWALELLAEVSKELRKRYIKGG
ncbi:MAG: methionine synthase [Dehalococcoidia bacterium]|nr:methionine synthase [Dehalococcoidia bacterium]